MSQQFNVGFLLFVHYLCAGLVMVYVKSLSARCQKIRSIKGNTIGNTRGIFCTALITFRPFSYRNSDQADGGSRSRVCGRTLDPPLAPPIDMSGNFPSHVSAELPSNNSPISKVLEPYDNFWKYPLCPPKYSIVRGIGGVPNFFLFCWNPTIFVT